MCPEDQSLSAYFDGEVDNATKEFIDHHLDSCSLCRQKIDDYTGMRIEFSQFDEEEVERAQIEVYRALKRDSRFQKQPVFWRRRVLVPAPILALSAVVICTLFTTLFLTVGNQSGAPVALRNEKSLQLKLDEIQLEELSQFFDSQDFMIEAEMDIPEKREFSILGEPKLLRVEEIKKLK